MRYHEVIQAYIDNAKCYLAVISAPKFKNSKIYVLTFILKKTVFIPSRDFSAKIGSEIEHFSAYRNRRSSSSPTMWWASTMGNSCVPEPGHYLVPTVLKSCISTAYGRSTSSWDHGNKWGFTWYIAWGIYTRIPTWKDSHNSAAAAEAPSLKISSHGPSRKWSWRTSQSTQE